MCVEIGCVSNSSESPKVNLEDSSLVLLTQKIGNADTVLLTSHTGYEGTNQIELVIQGKINRKIIQEEKIIRGSDIDTLISILAIPKPDYDSLSAKCFEPHHTIFILKKTEISYIDLCFHCSNLVTSKDLPDIKPFGERKWNKLLAFYKKLQLNYELP